MRILVTGATGFVGKRLGLELVRHGHQVVALVRGPARLPYPVEFHHWDEKEPLRDIDMVVHLAGESIADGRWTKKRKEKILKSRTETAERLLQRLRLCEGRKPQLFLSASAVGFYGDRGAECLTEESLPGQGFLAETCIAWEAATEKARDFIPRVVSLRFGMVLERHGGALATILPVFKRGLGGKLGSGRQWMSWIHLEDLVQLILYTVRTPEVNGVYNAVAPEPVTNEVFTKTLGQALGVHTPFAVPALALKAALGEMSELLLASQQVSPAKILKLGFRFRYDRLVTALGAITKSVEKGRGALCQEHFFEHWLPQPPGEVFPVLAEPKIGKPFCPITCAQSLRAEAR